MNRSRSFRIAIDGHTLEAAWWASPSDAVPSIVLLHEGLGCVAMWRDFPQTLADATGLGVFAYSRIGYGRSDPAVLPRPLSYMHDQARSLGRVLDAAGIADCVLLGHSDGASIAAVYAGTARDGRVRGLILIAPHFFVEDVTIAGIAAARAAYRTTNLRARLARYHADPDNAFLGWNGAWLDPAFRDWRIDDVLPHIEVPVLILQGADDEYGTAEQLRIAERACRCEVRTALIAGAAHAPHLTAPDRVLRWVAPFIVRLCRSSARGRHPDPLPKREGALYSLSPASGQRAGVRGYETDLDSRVK